MGSAYNFDATAPTWMALYHAGALTYDRQSAGTLRVANSAVLSLIHSRVDTVFAERHQLGSFLTTWFKYNMQNNPQPFLDLMSQVLHDLTLRSLGKKREPDLRGVFELGMQRAALPHRPVDPLILLPPDVARVEIPAYPDGVHVWELKTLTLRGMWLGANPNEDEPTVEDLRTLHEELVCLDDEELLARPYRTWSATHNATETVSVESFFDPEPEVPQFVAVGGARILRRDSVFYPLDQFDDGEEEDVERDEAGGEQFYDEEQEDLEGDRQFYEEEVDGDGISHGEMWP